MSDSNILLTVLARDKSSEVLVIDGSFEVLKRGIQSVELHVEPGIYRAKARVGDQQCEKLFSVETNEPNNHKIVELDPVEFSSPIPLEQTSTTHEYHQQAIRDATLNSGVTHRLGEGANLIIFLRDPSKIYFNLDAEKFRSYETNFRGFNLSSWDDSGHSVNLEEIGKLRPDQGYLIASAQVNPGAYALSRLFSDTERMYSPLVVPEGWSLQAFITMDAAGDESFSRQANFDEMAIAFDRLNSEFDPKRLDLRVLELTRQALARRYNVIDEPSMAGPISNSKDPVMSELLQGKFQNPMMGLLAAHLLLLDKQPNLVLAKTVIENTGDLIGTDYPDILALSWKLHRLQNIATPTEARILFEKLKSPPMLRLSWHSLMEMHRSLPDPGFLDTRLSNLSRRFVSSSVWLSWVDISQSSLLARRKSFSAPILGFPWLTHKHWSDVIETFPTNEDQAKLTGVATNEPEGFRVSLATQTFRLLVEQIDWVKIVRTMKTASLGGVSLGLTPLQSQIILALKAAREQLVEEDNIPIEYLTHLLTTSDVPEQAIIDDLKYLGDVSARIFDAIVAKETPPSIRS